ncbi:MAG: hypothetical protein Q8R28_04125 [Dehalococcoidia bacterium]|nr:hypothetical protein [Dehalococcoidia bacterium]
MPERECPLEHGHYVTKDHFDATADGLWRRLDRFEERVEDALQQRPGREEVAALIGKASAEAVLQASKVRNGRNGSANRGSAWWEQWGRTMATVIGVIGAIGAGVAALWQTLRGGTP